LKPPEPLIRRRNPMPVNECDYCGQSSPSSGLRLCGTCALVEQEAQGDLSLEAMYRAAVRLLAHLRGGRI
jgi:hypothetical protein